MNHDNEELAAHLSPFEAIRRVSDEGAEYWSAPDLAKILGYNRWENFQNVISN